MPCSASGALLDSAIRTQCLQIIYPVGVRVFGAERFRYALALAAEGAFAIRKQSFPFCINEVIGLASASNRVRGGSAYITDRAGASIKISRVDPTADVDAAARIQFILPPSSFILAVHALPMHRDSPETIC